MVRILDAYRQIFRRCLKSRESLAQKTALLDSAESLQDSLMFHTFPRPSSYFTVVDYLSAPYSVSRLELVYGEDSFDSPVITFSITSIESYNQYLTKTFYPYFPKIAISKVKHIEGLYVFRCSVALFS